MEEEDPVKSTEPEEHKKPDHRNTIIYVLIIVVIGLVACFGTYLFLSSENKHQDHATADTSVSEPTTDTAKPEKTEESDKSDGALPESTMKTGLKSTAKPTPAKQQEDSDYLIPGSDTRKVTVSDLAGMSAQELTYARNEIYARHGKVFKHNELNRYFQTKSWYHADPSFVDTMTSSLEQNNASFILQYQKDN